MARNWAAERPQKGFHMSGGFSIGGLVTGLNSNQIISQLIALERAPISRLEDKISELNAAKSAVTSLRSTLQTLRNRVQDFRLTNLFNQFQSTSSEESVLTATVSGESPVSGAYAINVIQLASATTANSSARLGAAINTGAALNSSGISTEISTGTFTINGVQLSVDPSTDSLTSVINAINSSGAGVTATYNAGTDTLTIANTAANDTSIINFGATGDTSNLLDVLALTGATQSTNGNGSTEATSTRNLGAIDATDILNTVNFGGGAITAGSFKINGITITVDPTTDSLSDVLGRINGSDAGVTASYDSSTDTIRVVSGTLGSRTISFQAGTSNFLSVTNLAAATQTAGADSQFTINGGATLTRNTNEVADAIGGVTLRLLSVGTSTVTVSVDDDAIVEDVNELLTAYNDAITAIRDQVRGTGPLRGDTTFQQIEDYLRGNIFNQISGISGSYESLADIGITTGDSFDSGTVSPLQLDEDTFREALRTNRTNVEDLFSNSNDNGIADIFFDFLDEATSTTGYLNQRVKSNGSIDTQIQDLNDRIDRMEDRIAAKERRLRAQFTRLESMASQFQQQGASLAGIQSSFLSI
ncbi:MAG: flagellar filament capping protein FliD [Candidatus Hydrogenedentes bacterium]|nr:flagellar filament capping protein FliD [Candidatus Hydrogenedentota bacterium]